MEKRELLTLIAFFLSRGEKAYLRFGENIIQIHKDLAKQLETEPGVISAFKGAFGKANPSPIFREIKEKYQNKNDDEIYSIIKENIDISNFTLPESETVVTPENGKIQIRCFTDEGRFQYRNYLHECLYFDEVTFPDELLFGNRMTYQIGGAGIIDSNKAIETRYELGKYLESLLANLDQNLDKTNPHIWDWISAFMFKKIYQGGGKQEQRYYMDTGRLKYRHMCYGPWLLYNRFGEYSETLLTNKIYELGDIYEQIASRQDMLHPNLILFMKKIYLMPNTRNLRRGVATIGGLGGFRRLVDIVNRFAANYDITSMNEQLEQKIRMFTDEFDQFIKEEVNE
jgi:hypothetical protein